MTEIMLLALIPMFAVLNRIRGKFGAGGLIGGLGMGAAVMLFTGDPEAATVCAILYAAGESVGWGRWLKALGRVADGVSQQEYMEKHRQPDRGKVIHKLAQKIMKESKDYEAYAWAALWIRASIWMPPIFIALAAFGHTNPISAIAGAAACIILFPASYWAAREMGKSGWWGRGEVIYGAVQGAALAAAFFA